MLKIILNRLKPQAETIIAEEQAGFRTGRSTTEQIFNLRVICEKYLQHRQDLYHVFIDFKKAFDRVWHAALWSTMRKYNINDNLVRVIEQLYEKATSAVLLNGIKGDWFRTYVGVRQGCLLSPTLFNIFLERIMEVALENHVGTVSIGGRTITNLRFADDIDGLAGSEDELSCLVQHLDNAASKFGMEINQCRENQAHDKQRPRHCHRYQSQRDIIRDGGKFQISWVHHFRRRFKTRSCGKDCTNNSRAIKASDHLERQEHQSALKDQPDALTRSISLSICLRNLDIECRSPKKNPCNRNEVLQENSRHPLHRSCDKLRS